MKPTDMLALERQVYVLAPEVKVKWSMWIFW